MYGILSGSEIHEQVKQGHITVDPFKPEKLNPTSIDLTLGRGVSIYRGTYLHTLHDRPFASFTQQDGQDFRPDPNVGAWDSKEPREVDTFEMSDDGWELQPGIGYLLHTAERITTNHFVPVLDGKSSIGRAFILVHYTAGYGDPGFDGQYTLEVTSLFPVRIYPGMRFCQMRFHTLVGQPHLYQERGHYTGEAAQGAIASQIHKQFD